MFPKITQEKQALFEKFCLANPETFINDDKGTYIPCICGYYGRACRQMGNKADRILCRSCYLKMFVQTVEEIQAKCIEKESIGIKNLYDSDIYDIADALKRKHVRVGYSYVDKVLDFLAEKFSWLRNRRKYIC